MQLAGACREKHHVTRPLLRLRNAPEMATELTAHFSQVIAAHRVVTADAID